MNDFKFLRKEEHFVLLAVVLKNVQVSCMRQIAKQNF